MPRFIDDLYMKDGYDKSVKVVDTNGNLYQANSDRTSKIAKMALGVVDTAGGVLSWANPEGSEIIINNIILDITTKSTGACTLDVGTTAASATTLSDNLINGVNVASNGVYDNITDKGDNGKSRQKLASGKWVTASKASGTAAGLVGFAYIHYVIA